MNPPIFLQSADLGVLESHINMALDHAERRTRTAKFRHLARLLRDLGLTPKDRPIIGLARGIDSLGKQGVWLILEQDFTSVQAPAPATPHQLQEGASNDRPS